VDEEKWVPFVGCHPAEFQDLRAAVRSAQAARNTVFGYGLSAIGKGLSGFTADQLYNMLDVLDWGSQFRHAPAPSDGTTYEGITDAAALNRAKKFVTEAYASISTARNQFEHSMQMGRLNKEQQADKDAAATLQAISDLQEQVKILRQQQAKAVPNVPVQAVPVPAVSAPVIDRLQAPVPAPAQVPDTTAEKKLRAAEEEAEMLRGESENCVNSFMLYSRSSVIVHVLLLHLGRPWPEIERTRRISLALDLGPRATNLCRWTKIVRS